MASLRAFCFSLFLLFLQTRAQPMRSNLISSGSSLSPNTNQSSWLSLSGLFAFGFYPQGNGFSVGIWLADKPNFTVVWTANRNDPPVSWNATIDFTEDGEFLLRTGQGEKKVFIELSDPAFSASMQDSGNLVIYSNDSEVIWESFWYPTDTILGGQSISDTQLNARKSTSDHSSGRYYLTVKPYEIGAFPVNHSALPEEAYWRVDIETLGQSARLNLSLSGVLKLSSPVAEAITLASSRSSAAENETMIYRLTIDSDGNVRLYSHLFETSDKSTVTIEWSAVRNQCQVNGFCGFNSYCSMTTGKADCYCFPGFNFINIGEKNFGCYRSFIDEEGCERKEPADLYNISELQATKLGGYPYAILPVGREDCRESCLNDCYCAAAFYFNGTCGKQKLPLLFGLLDENDQAFTVFIKTISGNVNLKSIPKIPESEIVVSESKKSFITILTASLGFMASLCFLIAVSSHFVNKHRLRRYRKPPENSNLLITQEISLRSFSYNELEQATNGFNEELGRGHFGAVFKGTISEGNKAIAVKRLENYIEDGQKKFRAEIAAVRRTHHRNLVPLLGFCMEDSRKLLVYEYMSNGSLADLLFNSDRRPLWNERVRIALDVARGVLYLHEECEVQIIHCNIKPRNILMDESWTSKISDFGLAKLLMPNQSIIDTDDRGSIGYVAPEWQKNGLITVKSDVYSYGIVVLEIICCRSNMEINVSTADEVLLSTWVYKCFAAGELNKLVGDEEVEMRTLERMVKVGLLCIQDDPNLRPSMKKVILMLEGTLDIPIPQCPNPLIVI